MYIGLPSLGLRQSSSGLDAAIRALFAAGEQGGWYDPSDISTMWQDSAGITPAVLESPVGKINDKSGRGNHLIQATAASRPTLSARYNKLTKSTQFEDATWTKTGSSVPVTNILDPTGTTQAREFREDSSTGQHVLVENFTFTAGDWKLRFWAKPNGRTWMVAQTRGSFSYFNMSGAGSLGTTSGTIVSRAITAAANGYYLIELTVTATAGADNVTIYLAQADGVVSYTGDGVSGAYVYGADLRTSADAGLAIPAYQRVDTATSYDTAGFPMYLILDAVDDSMSNTTTALGAVSFHAASIINTQALNSVGNITDGTVGRQLLGVSLTVTPEYYRAFEGVTLGSATPRIVGTADVLVANFANGASTTLERNKTTLATGNAGNSPLTGGLTLGAAPAAGGQNFGGRIYGVILRDTGVSAAQKAIVYTYLGSKMGVNL